MPSMSSLAGRPPVDFIAFHFAIWEAQWSHV